ncbi:hypothetical protein PILCRDRAFT_783505 [Piloderma croceum F 1598]|uniref:Protein kinase domain-containing protein n=1 Tax=Piloderma croceum (strain F 1598) TaxID=765440 RepID=A0A0C3BAG1_PILCF|nr:hypothetical protein PILCRDRAFT_783505 [Piloderma croceum F 1598]
MDDRQECVSLLFRFHEAGWNHGSVALRNILMQPGPLSVWPLLRGTNNTSSFRLIDFGRSSKCTSETMAMEEMEAYKALGLATWPY